VAGSSACRGRERQHTEPEGKAQAAKGRSQTYGQRPDTKRAIVRLNWATTAIELFEG